MLDFSNAIGGESEDVTLVTKPSRSVKGGVKGVTEDGSGSGIPRGLVVKRED